MTPSILHCHNLPSLLYLSQTSNSKLLTKISYLLLYLVEGITLINSDCVIISNQTLKHTIIIRGVHKDRIVVLPTPIDLERFSSFSEDHEKLKREFNILPAAFTFGYIGRLSLEKNLTILLKAFPLVFQKIKSKDINLILVGDGVERRRLENYATELGIRDYVAFLAFRFDIPKVLEYIDVFILPSKTEGSPLSLLEAMACGKAVIASDIPPIREIVKDGKEALLFDPHSSAQLKDAMLKLYLNSELRRQLGDNAKKRRDNTILTQCFPK